MCAGLRFCVFLCKHSENAECKYSIHWRCVPIAANNSKDTLTNEDINFPQVRVIGSDGEQLGIMSSEQALKMAYDKGLDLCLMSPFHGGRYQHPP